MKILRNFLFTLLCAVPMMALAQSENPVKWSHSVSDNGEGRYTVQMKATMADGWHIYDLGPYEFITATSLKFEPSEGVTPVGDLRVLSKAVRHMDDIFGIEIGYFEKEAIFEQDFEGEGDVKVAIEYMACNDTNCTPPAEEEMVVTLGNAENAPKAEVKAVKDAAGEGSLWSLIKSVTGIQSMERDTKPDSMSIWTQKRSSA